MNCSAKSLSATLTAFLAFSLLPHLQAQDSTGTVFGAVICNDGNTPARGARISLIPVDRLLSQKGAEASNSTSSDFAGTYEARSIPPGTYVVNATLDGYDDDLKLVASVLDKLTPEDRKKLIAAFPEVTVKPGASVRKDLILRRAAAISGHATVDVGGLPGRVSVTATRVSETSRDNSPIDRAEQSEPFTQSTLTDDRGAFRIAGLPAGKYRISLRITEAYFAAAIGKNGVVHIQPERQGTAELEVYAPEGLDQDHARLVSVNDGDEITDADITIPMRFLHSITGVVTKGGTVAAAVPITLERKGRSLLGYSALSMPDGSYRFDLLPSGSYIIRAKDTASSSAGETVVQILDSDVLDTNIDLHGPESPVR
jgi:hypothetical protein